ncbi:MAG: ergothioneine biosynthesis protein EgtC [Myxococcota bacterium]
MCRILAYRGPERTLAELLLDPPHSLEVQSYQPREMETALMNADGFGVAWYVDGEATPARFRSVLPMWADENFPELARPTRSRCVLANVRSATPGVGFGLANTQPFVHGGWSFTHNGYVEGWFRDGVMRRMRASLGDVAYGALRGTSDSEHLFGLFLEAMEAGADAEAALLRVKAQVAELAPDRKALLSLAVTDGRRIVALRTSWNAAAPSLYRRRLEDGSAWLASEATDATEGWEPVPVDVPITLEAA